GLDPVEETVTDELDVGAHPTTEVHEMDLHVVAVPVDQRADLVDVGSTTSGGVDVDDESVLPCGTEDPVQLLDAPRAVHLPAEEEARREDLDALLGDVLQRAGVQLRVLGPR